MKLKTKNKHLVSKNPIISRNDNKINLVYEQLFPYNCPVIEYTADGENFGVCTFYLKDQEICPRHGKVK